MKERHQMSSTMLSIVSISVLLFMVQYGKGQIPSQCVDSLSQTGTRCCPELVINNKNFGECGMNSSRGNCMELSISQTSEQMMDNDPRVRWPIKYFTHVCVCADNYGGVDCGSCAYGRYPHPTCEKMLIAKRRNLKHYSNEDWEKYLNVIKMTRTYDSGYKAIVNGDLLLQGMTQSSIDNEKRTISLYNFFVWTHYLVAKDSESMTQKRDFAHEGTGFLTWHRQMLLWLEWKIQEMLRVMNNDKNYHKFRLPYWDWTDVNERSKYFTEERLGESLYEDETIPHRTTKLKGTLFGSGDSEWQTICWRREGPDGSNCDPNDKTGPLLRCPKRSPDKEHSDPCNSSADYWPTMEEAWNAVEKLNLYDAKDSAGIYSACPIQDNFRGNLEGFRPLGSCIETDLMCSGPKPGVEYDCSRTRTLHNSVHIILGAADIKGLDPNHDLHISPQDQGVMSHVAASPNDPIFINHHAMIDCIFEDWFKKGNYGQYPEGPNKDGHGIDDNIVPFIPLYTHRDMFKPSMNFGYVCGAVALAPVFFVTLITSISALVLSIP